MHRKKNRNVLLKKKCNDLPGINNALFSSAMNDEYFKNLKIRKKNNESNYSKLSSNNELFKPRKEVSASINAIYKNSK